MGGNRERVGSEWGENREGVRRELGESRERGEPGF